jgi:hypothetical protein
MPERRKNIAGRRRKTFTTFIMQNSNLDLG